MADWQMGMAGSRAGFGELMDDGLGRMMEEGRAIILCQARCWSVTIRGTAMKRQAVIEGGGKVGREQEGWSVGEQPQSPAQGRVLATGLARWDPARRGAQPHTGQQALTWALP